METRKHDRDDVEKPQEPSFPEGVQVESGDARVYHVTPPSGKTWDVVVVADGGRFRWRLEQDKESKITYASERSALLAAVECVLRSEATSSR